MRFARLSVYLALAAFAAFLALPAVPALAATYVVDTTSDATLTACTGAAADCSLRGAIANANTSGAVDVINFDPTVFPSGAPVSINIGSALPNLGGPSAGNDTIDGTGAGVIVDTASEPSGFACISISSNGNTVRNLQFTDCGIGVSINSGTGNTLGPGNTFFDNSVGISIDSSGNKAIGNKIGTNSAGAAIPAEGGNTTGIALGLNSTGNTVGGTAAASRNIISGNGTGLSISGPGNTVRGNYIGMDVTGLVDLGNSNNGIDMSSVSSTTIGGTGAGEGNLISGNGGGNILMNGSSGNTISGNIIGPDITGSGAATTNGNVGIGLSLGASGNIIGPGNVISDNLLAGVSIFGLGTDSNAVKANLIGTNLSGLSSVPNGQQGVFVSGGARFNTIGGPYYGEGNIIAFNGQQGVDITDAGTTGNSIRGNSIHDNSGAEIALLAGGNLGLAAPTLAAGSAAASSVGGTGCPNCTIDVFSTGSGTDPRIFEGSTTANAAGAFTFYGGLLTGPSLLATQTDTFGNTSSLSAAVAAELCNGIDDDGDGFSDEGYQDTDSDGRKDCVDSGQTCFDPAGTLSCPIRDCTTLAEDFDAFKDFDGCPDPDNDNDSFPDAADRCPGSDAAAGANGMLGSPQDLNHNGIQDGAESSLTSDDSVLTFEDYDGVLDTDGCHDSPGEDFDGDGFTDDNEALFIGTDPGYPCGNNGWPADLDSAGLSANKLTLSDVTSFLGPVYRLNSSPGDAAFSARWDLVPGKNIFADFINLQDLTSLIPSGTSPTARPPMFNGEPAMNQTCPYPP